eukprot:203604-Pleurochrysis_carterae.AAC.1
MPPCNVSRFLPVIRIRSTFYLSSLQESPLHRTPSSAITTRKSIYSCRLASFRAHFRPPSAPNSTTPSATSPFWDSPAQSASTTMATGPSPP